MKSVKKLHTHTYNVIFSPIHVFKCDKTNKMYSLQFIPNINFHKSLVVFFYVFQIKVRKTENYRLNLGTATDVTVLEFITKTWYNNFC